MLTRARVLLVFALIVVSLGLAAASLMIGTETVSVHQAWADWRAGMTRYESPSLSILINQRLPRTLAALIAGAGLALVGCGFQALLRNPLATPYTLGVATAGSLGAYIAFVFELGGAFRVLGFSAVEASALLFAWADMTVIYLLASRRARLSPFVLLLAGVTLSMLASSGIMLMRYFASPDRLVMMERWLMGGVDIVGYEAVVALAIGVTPCLLILLAQGGKLDQLGFGHELAAGRGVNVPRLQAVTFLVGSLTTALIVSKVGPIGFVGLIVPHAVRTVTGSRHRVLMPVSLVAGGGFLCFCDIVARKALPGETPIGIVTALLGGPFFLYLLTRRHFTDWQA
ncbi:MAG TPA: iron ABC transporter permease [Candidatus Hydrogenedentes bacterium]|nr:iron ABC transporter permease [Candidatus Hydrogenedentota bacterium]HIJ74950.1 iron ABC transporter permease [Candidatus Hydrogenedentota bacterium]